MDVSLFLIFSKKNITIFFLFIFIFIRGGGLCLLLRCSPVTKEAIERNQKKKKIQNKKNEKNESTKLSCVYCNRNETYLNIDILNIVWMDQSAFFSINTDLGNIIYA